MFKCISILIVLYGIICIAEDIDSLYDDRDVTNLTPENFKNEIIDDKFESIWIVVFYAPWCAYSQALVPEFIDAAKRLRGEINFGAINGDKYPSLCRMYGVSSFPNIKVFGKNKEKPEDYLGPRERKDLIRAGWTAVLNNWFDA